MGFSNPKRMTSSIYTQCGNDEAELLEAHSIRARLQVRHETGSQPPTSAALKVCHCPIEWLAW
jgi:hypothetical protein